MPTGSFLFGLLTTLVDWIILKSREFQLRSGLNQDLRVSFDGSDSVSA